MLISFLRYRYVKARMTAYLDGELSVSARRFIARQIDEDPRCYRAYISARRTRQSLEQDLPRLGIATASQLDTVWQRIQADINAPEPVMSPPPERPGYSLGYGVAILALVVILLTPLVLDTGRTGIAPMPQHPPPEDTALATSRVATPTPETRVVALVVESEGQTPASNRIAIPLQNTPAPHTPGN